VSAAIPLKKYLENPKLAFAPTPPRRRKSQLDPYVGNIEAWLAEDSCYTGTWIYDRLSAMGFSGSYEIVKRKVRQSESPIPESGLHAF
jgi:hypothetical protein